MRSLPTLSLYDSYLKGRECSWGCGGWGGARERKEIAKAKEQKRKKHNWRCYRGEKEKGRERKRGMLT